MIPFEYEDFDFEFSPDGVPTAGELEVFQGENTLFGARLDLASTRSRNEWVKEACELYPDIFEDAAQLKRGLVELYAHVKETARIAEAKRAEEEENENASDELSGPEEGTEPYQRAMTILQAEDVLERFAKDMLKLGHVGEWKNKKLAGVCALSARAELPIQPSTHAVSSAGKNHLWDNALKLLPPELVFKRTGITAKALFRTQMSLKHSVLYIQERAGSEEAEFSIRTLQSDGALRYESPEKQPDGSIENRVYEVEGPCIVVQTTTRNHLHPENETRVVPLYLDETAAQTERIINEAKKRAAGIDTLSRKEESEICETWHEAVRLLQPANIVISYAERIQIPSTPIRLRRDAPRLFDIIKVVAWMHQYRRTKDDMGRIVATEEDFETALDIVGESFSRAWKSLTPSEEKVYEACKTLPDHLRKHGFKRPEVEKALKQKGETVSFTSVKDALASLAGSGYLECDKRGGTVGYTYTLPEKSTITSSISLAPAGRSAAKAANEEIPANGHNSTAEPEFGRSRPLAGNEDEADNEDELEKTNGRAAKSGRDRGRPVEMDDLQGKRATGRAADENQGKKVNREYEYVTEEEE
jgi:hypothetical protein